MLPEQECPLGGDVAAGVSNRWCVGRPLWCSGLKKMSSGRRCGGGGGKSPSHDAHLGGAFFQWMYNGNSFFVSFWVISFGPLGERRNRLVCYWWFSGWGFHMPAGYASCWCWFYCDKEWTLIIWLNLVRIHLICHIAVTATTATTYRSFPVEMGFYLQLQNIFVM